MRRYPAMELWTDVVSPPESPSAMDRDELGGGFAEGGEVEAAVDELSDGRQHPFGVAGVVADDGHGQRRQADVVQVGDFGDGGVELVLHLLTDRAHLAPLVLEREG